MARPASASRSASFELLRRLAWTVALSRDRSFRSAGHVEDGVRECRFLGPYLNSCARRKGRNDAVEPPLRAIRVARQPEVREIKAQPRRGWTVRELPRQSLVVTGDRLRLPDLLSAFTEEVDRGGQMLVGQLPGDPDGVVHGRARHVPARESPRRRPSDGRASDRALEGRVGGQREERSAADVRGHARETYRCARRARLEPISASRRPDSPATLAA